MIALGERKKKAYEDSFIGKEVEVLFEERAQIEGKAVMTGHTKEYIKAAVLKEYGKENRILSGSLKKELKPHVRLCTID